MDSRDDSEYLRLYQDYAKAIQAFENATKDRRSVRNQLAVKRSPVIQALRAWERRPVGSPRDTHIPRDRPTPPVLRRAVTLQPRRIYMGDTLGWATVAYYTMPVVPELDPAASVDVDKLYDRTSLHIYWNAKAHYKKCKSAFFDYVRRQNIELHKERATSALAHGAQLQLLGLDESSEPEFLKEAKKEVEAACRSAWALYQSSGAKKSTEMKILLAESIADAQYVDLETTTVQAMMNELDRLVSAGDLSK